MNRTQKMKLALLVNLALALVMFSSAFALTITVDGFRESTWDNGAGILNDDIGDTFGGAPDILSFEYTNSPDTFYFLLSTFADYSWDGIFEVWICLDTDNNQGTGIWLNDCSEGGLSGVDRVVNVYNHGEGLKVEVMDHEGTPPSAGMLPTAHANYSVLEIGVAAADLNISSANQCISNIPAAVRIIDIASVSYDELPATGDLHIGCGAPTAVKLSTLSARQASLPWLWGAGSALLLSAAGMALALRRKVQ